MHSDDASFFPPYFVWTYINSWVTPNILLPYFKKFASFIVHTLPFHEIVKNNCNTNFLYRYAAEMPVVIIQSVIYLGILAMTRIARPNFSKLCYRRSDKNIFLIQTGLKMIAVWSILASYVLPFFIIPHTVHPVLGWTLYLFGSFTLCSVAINTFLLPMIAVLILWIGIFGSLLVMAYPWYPDGVVRALAVFGYAFCSAPFLWISIVKIMTSLQVSLEREAFFPKLGESAPPSGFNKLY